MLDPRATGHMDVADVANFLSVSHHSSCYPLLPIH